MGATPALSAADMTTIEKKLDMIVSRLDRVESQMAEVKEANNSEVDTISKSVKDLKKEVANLAITKPAAPVKTVKKTDPTPKVATSKPSSSNSKVTWELRAAQPGKAWVSKAGQKELTPVTVGDDLSGIGRITSITYVSNRWIVQGTSGKITQ
jgi:intracellular multiplication protein IcmG